jgi:transposase
LYILGKDWSDLIAAFLKGGKRKVEVLREGRSTEMPKHVKARAAQDEQEEQQVRKLAKSLHAPTDWKSHAHMVVESWAGKTPDEIATKLGCHPQTVRIHLARFNAQGVDGLGMRAGSGRKPSLSQQERSRILALAKQAPPGHLETQADGTMVARDEEGSAQWTLNALAQAAQEAGIPVKRSQIRRIYLREGVRWRRTHSWGDSSDPEFVPKGPRSSPTTPSRPRGRRPSAPTNWGQ